MGLVLSRVICNVVGSIYPGYMSYKAVTTKNVEEYMRWMKYWTVYSFFMVAEIFLDFFAALLPLYYEFKVVFILYLMLPQFKGSDTVFNGYLAPLLKEHEDTIEDNVGNLKARAMDKATGFGTEAMTATRRMAADSLLSVSSALASAKAAAEEHQAAKAAAARNSENGNDMDAIPPAYTADMSHDKKTVLDTLVNRQRMYV
eukprot:m.321583 g.321583  ORF g.321583 m.321583 type:complete len:201 (+) comp20337_c0_seq7:228-830(+)